MDETVLVVLSAEQRADGESRSFETRALGHLRRQENAQILTYRGRESGPARVTIEDGAVTAERESGVFRYLPGKRTATDYRTPFGSIPLTVYTKDIQKEERTDALSLTVRYTLEQGGAAVSENRLTITIWKRKDKI